MIARFFLGVALCALMLISSLSTYIYLGGRHNLMSSAIASTAVGSPRAKAFTLPGTLYLSQNGALYSLSIGRFHQLTREDGWTQPYWNASGNNLLAVHRTPFYSDVYIIGRFGQITQSLTANGPPPRSNDTTLMHWSFYPRLGPDNNTLYSVGFDKTLRVWNVNEGKETKKFGATPDDLFGLAQALKAQGRDASAVEERFRKAWGRGDVTLTASRF